MITPTLNFVTTNIINGSTKENHLPHFWKSDVIDDVTVTSWVGDDVIYQFS